MCFGKQQTFNMIRPVPDANSALDVFAHFEQIYGTGLKPYDVTARPECSVHVTMENSYLVECICF